MVSLNLRLRKVGNSLGIVVPSGVVTEKRLREGEELNVTIEVNGKSTGEDFVRESRKWNLKTKRTTKEIFEEIDEGDD